MLIFSTGLVTKYNFKAYSADEKDGKTVITASFPVSSYQNSDRYILLIPDIGKTGNNDKFATVIPGTEVDLIKK